MAYFDSGNFNYRHLRGQNSDILQEVSAISQISVSWKIINMLPTKLVLWVEKYLSGEPKYFATIEPHAVLEYPPNTFSDQDQLYTYINISGKLYPFLQPYTFREIWKTIRLGAATYSSEDGHAIVQSIHWAMRGVWIHNRIAYPLDVYYKGNLVAQVGGYNGIEYMGGGNSSVYFTNSREGLNLGDEIEFKYSLPGTEGKRLFSVILNDNSCVSIYVGVVSGGFRGPDPDNAVYRIDKPSYTGITYYENIDGYSTKATNPRAPF